MMARREQKYEQGSEPGFENGTERSLPRRTGAHDLTAGHEDPASGARSGSGPASTGSEVIQLKDFRVGDTTPCFKIKTKDTGSGSQYFEIASSGGAMTYKWVSDTTTAFAFSFNDHQNHMHFGNDEYLVDSSGILDVNNEAHSQEWTRTNSPNHLLENDTTGRYLSKSGDDAVVDTTGVEIEYESVNFRVQHKSTSKFLKFTASSSSFTWSDTEADGAQFKLTIEHPGYMSIKGVSPIEYMVISGSSVTTDSTGGQWTATSDHKLKYDTTSYYLAKDTSSNDAIASTTGDAIKFVPV